MTVGVGLVSQEIGTGADQLGRSYSWELARDRMSLGLGISQA